MAEAWAWIVAHQGVVVGFAVGLLDLIIALMPQVESNGVFHTVYLWVKGLAKKPDAPTLPDSK